MTTKKLHLPVGIDLCDPKRCIPGEHCAVDDTFGNPPIFLKCGDVECVDCIAFWQNVTHLRQHIRDNQD